MKKDSKEQSLKDSFFHQNKSNWWLYLVGLVAVAIVVNQVIILFTPSENTAPTPTITKNTSGVAGGESPNLNNISYTGPKQLSLPNKMPVFTVQEDAYTTGNIEEKLVERFGLIESSSTQDVWTSSEYILRKVGGPSFQLSSIEPAGDFDKIDHEQVVDLVAADLSSMFPKLNLKPVEEEIGYFRGGLHLTGSTPSRAQCINIPFSYLIESEWPVYYEQRTTSVAEILVCGNNDLRKLIIDTPLPTFSKSFEAKTASIAKAVEAINSNTKSAIIEALKDSHGPLNLNQIQKGTLSSVSVEYRLDKGLDLLYPFYRFKGTVTNNNQQQISIQVVTPAIITQE